MDVVADFAPLEAKASASRPLGQHIQLFRGFISVHFSQQYVYVCLMLCHVTLYDSVILFPPLFLHMYARPRDLLRFACLKDEYLSVSNMFSKAKQRIDVLLRLRYLFLFISVTKSRHIEYARSVFLRRTDPRTCIAYL